MRKLYIIVFVLAAAMLSARSDAHDFHRGYQHAPQQHSYVQPRGHYIPRPGYDQHFYRYDHGHRFASGIIGSILIGSILYQTTVQRPVAAPPYGMRLAPILCFNNGYYPPQRYVCSWAYIPIQP